MLRTLPYAVAALILDHLTPADWITLDLAYKGQWRPAAARRRRWLARKYATKWLSGTRVLDQEFRTGHFDLAKGELITLVEAEACPVRLAALFHQWRNRCQQLVSTERVQSQQRAGGQ